MTVNSLLLKSFNISCSYSLCSLSEQEKNDLRTKISSVQEDDLNTLIVFTNKIYKVVLTIFTEKITVPKLNARKMIAKVYQRISEDLFIDEQFDLSFDYLKLKLDIETSNDIYSTRLNGTQRCKDTDQDIMKIVLKFKCEFTKKINAEKMLKENKLEQAFSIASLMKDYDSRNELYSKIYHAAIDCLESDLALNIAENITDPNQKKIYIIHAHHQKLNKMLLEICNLKIKKS